MDGGGGGRLRQGKRETAILILSRPSLTSHRLGQLLKDKCVLLHTQGLLTCLRYILECTLENALCAVFECVSRCDREATRFAPKGGGKVPLLPRPVCGGGRRGIYFGEGTQTSFCPLRRETPSLPLPSEYNGCSSSSFQERSPPPPPPPPRQRPCCGGLWRDGGLSLSLPASLMPPPPPGLLLRRIRYTTVCSREGGKEGGFLHCAILPLLFRPGKREKSYREKGGGKLVAVEEEKR